MQSLCSLRNFNFLLLVVNEGEMEEGRREIGSEGGGGGGGRGREEGGRLINREIYCNGTGWSRKPCYRYCPQP